MTQTKAKTSKGYKIKDTHFVSYYERTLLSLAESQISTKEFSEVEVYEEKL
jgi:hypothetical protein